MLQPLNVPVSNPPFVTPEPPPPPLDTGAVTVSEMVVECVALDPVPVIVTE